MQEVEVLRICESAFLKWFGSRFELRVSSSEVLDAIFEECQVTLADRIPLIKVLYKIKMEKQSFNSQIQDPGQKQLLERVNWTKILELMRIKGSCD